MTPGFGGLRTALEEVRSAVNNLLQKKRELEPDEETASEGATEEANMVQTSLLIADAALLRKESRGGHYRSDFPRAKRKWSGRHIEW